MVAYFRVQNNLFMAIGAGLGLLIAVFGLRPWIVSNAGYASAFVIGLVVFAGVIIGRILSAAWAKRKRESLLALLYREEQPEQFIEKFAPIVEKTPRNTVEYVDGTHHLAYAYEAMGDFDRSLELLGRLQPEELKMHTLVCCGLVTNQKLRLHLLKEETETAKDELEQLRVLQEAAAVRAPSVGKSLAQCVRLAEVWLECLDGNQENISYIQEEMSLANNWVHKREMSGLLERAAAAN